MTLEQLIGKLEKDFGLPEGLCFLLRCMQRVDVPRGTVLANGKSEPGGLFFLASGSIELIYERLGGDKGVCWITPGNVFMPGVDTKRSLCYLREAVSVEDSVLYYIGKVNANALYGLYDAFRDMVLRLRMRHWRNTGKIWYWEPAA